MPCEHSKVTCCKSFYARAADSTWLNACVGTELTNEIEETLQDGQWAVWGYQNFRTVSPHLVLQLLI
jgi:hypothetical protein